MYLNKANTFLNVPWIMFIHVKNEEVLLLPLTLQLSSGLQTDEYKIEEDVQVFPPPILYSLEHTICEHDLYIYN